MSLTRTPLALLALAGCLAPPPPPPDVVPPAPAPPTPAPTSPAPAPAPFAVLAPPAAAVPADVPLAAALTVAGSAPSTLAVTVADDLGQTFTVRWPTPAEAHEVAVLGLKPGRRHTLSVTLTDAAGVPHDAGAAVVDTLPLPYGFPQRDVLAHDPARVPAGYLLANVELSGADGQWLVAWDLADLEVAWLYTGVPDLDDVRMSDAGTLIGLRGGWPTELDLLGRVLRRWLPTPEAPEDRPLPVDNVHHELYPLPDGTFLTLSEATHRAAAYPTSYDTPWLREGPADLTASRVVRFDAEGAERSSWSLAERLDDGRIGFDSLDPWIRGLDWDHPNGVIPHPDGGVVVSVRHQDVLVRLDAEGELVWLLGDPAGWTAPWDAHLLRAEGPVTWPYHAHAPAFDEDGLLLVLDNHNEGHTPYTPAPVEPWRSRVVAYRIDEAAGTVAEAWSYAPDGAALQAPSLGDADPLPGGAVLAVFGNVTAEDGVPNPQLGRGSRSVRYVVFDPAAPAPPALDWRLWTPPEAVDVGVTSYRAEAVPSLYPAGVVVTAAAAP